MTIGVKGDLNLVALLVWCLFFTLEKGRGGGGEGGGYGLHPRGGRCDRKPRMMYL
jgi:hypothetical protein